MSDFFYDGQVRRYVSQFMRIFIGFKYQAGDGTLSTVPVAYGDLTRQVGAIIRENSENKMPSVPRISCYITNLNLDTNRLADASFVSKMNIRQRDYETLEDGSIEYKNTQGAGYTVERLMPTPFTLGMKCDIWTSNTDQKLQLLEQMLILFNPSLEVQTTDNYIDWTSLSAVYLENIGFSSRSIPAGVDSDIDICSLDFTMPIYITPPAKVKKLGIVKNVIMNIFTEEGNVADIGDLVYNTNEGTAETRTTIDGYKVILLKSQTGSQYDYDLKIHDIGQLALTLKISPDDVTIGTKLDWNSILELHGGYTNTSLIHFLQSNGYEISGTFTVNPIDPTILTISVDPDTMPTNTLDSITAIINPQTFNPGTSVEDGTRYLILEDIGENTPAWRLNAPANSIIEYDGSSWELVFDPGEEIGTEYVQNQRTLIQYKWDGIQWLKSFEGEYDAGYWRFDLNN